MTQSGVPEGVQSESIMRVRQVRTQDELVEITDAWLKLIEDGATGCSVNNDPRMIAAISRGQPAIDLNILALSHGGQLVCVAPLYLQNAAFQLKLSVWQLAAPRARMLRLFGEEFVFARDADRRQCIDLVLRAIRDFQRSFDLMWIDGLRQACELAEAGVSVPNIAEGIGMAAVVLRTDVNHRIRLPPTAEAYVASLGPSTRQNLRRTTRRFFEDGQAKFVTVSSPDEVSQLLTWIAEIDRNSWQGRTFTGQDRIGEAYRHRLQEIADCGWLRSYVLLKGERPVAFEHGYLYRGTYYGLECGFDARFSTAGPGSIVIFHAIQDVISACGAQYVDFGVGDMQYKRSFGNEMRRADTVYCLPPNWWRHIVRGQKLLDNLENGTRKLLTSMNLDRTIRKWIKRKN